MVQCFPGTNTSIVSPGKGHKSLFHLPLERSPLMLLQSALTCTSLSRRASGQSSILCITSILLKLELNACDQSTQGYANQSYCWRGQEIKYLAFYVFDRGLCFMRKSIPKCGKEIQSLNCQMNGNHSKLIIFPALLLIVCFSYNFLSSVRKVIFEYN